MSLSQTHKVTILIALATVVLTGVVHVLIREWYEPDLRYEKKGYYRSEKIAIASLRLTNFGHSDAEDIRIATRFNKPIKEVYVSDPSVVWGPKKDYIGKTRLSTKIDRMVPGQSLHIYYVISHPLDDPLEPRDDFVRQIAFKGGGGKTGRPRGFDMMISMLLAALVAFPVGYFGNRLPQWIYRRQFREHFTMIDKMITLAFDARKDNLTKEDLIVLLDKEIGQIQFRQDTLREVAIRAFDNVSPSTPET